MRAALTIGLSVLLVVVSLAVGVCAGLRYQTNQKPWCATEDSCKVVTDYNGHSHHWTFIVRPTVP